MAPPMCEEANPRKWWGLAEVGCCPKRMTCHMFIRVRIEGRMCQDCKNDISDEDKKELHLWMGRTSDATPPPQYIIYYISGIHHSRKCNFEIKFTARFTVVTTPDTKMT
jgi:hypothetical protein